MITIKFSKRYLTREKKFTKYNTARIEEIEHTLKLFLDNPVHPSLNLEKLTKSGVWSIRLSRGDRIFFIWLGQNTVLLVDIGKQDKYRNY